MKALFLKHPSLCVGGLAGLLALCSVTVHPSGSVKAAASRAVAANDLHVSPEVAPLLKRSCMDCHFPGLDLELQAGGSGSSPGLSKTTLPAGEDLGNVLFARRRRQQRKR